MCSKIYFPVLVFLRIRLAWGLVGRVLGRERARHCYIDGQTFAITPVLDRHISRAAARGRAQDALLLEHWREHALIGNVCNHVAKSVVAGDAISSVFAQQVAWSP